MSELSGVGYGFRRSFAETARPTDLTAIAVVPIILSLLFALPSIPRDSLVFETASPTIQTAYTAHFIHQGQLHLLGNLAVYLAVAPVTYLLCLLAGRRTLFRVTFVMLVTVFPFALSAFQLVFPRQRVILGFSGINAGLFGLLCVAWTVYVGQQILATDTQRYAPALLFITCGAVAAITLPSRAWRLEIVVASLAVGLVYLGLWLVRSTPSREQVAESFERVGYVELAGAGLGLVVAYPTVGFAGPVTVETGTVDVYIHLLGYALAFIVVYTYVELVEASYSSQ